MKSETQNGWMLVDILEKVEHDTFTMVRGELQDGSKFDLKVRTHLVDVIESEKGNRGWLSVEYQGQKERQASVVLPAPAQEYGHKVTIDIGRFKLAT